MNTTSFRKSSLFRYTAFTVLAAFVGLLPVGPGLAQVAIIMPPVGQMVHATGHFEPPQMVGLKINLKDPFSFGFIMDQGEGHMSDAVKKEEFNKIIKYFLVSLAMPNKDMWVNLSPFESKRVIPEVFGQTEMGRDLLAQDYVLKQFTASLMYPEAGLGKEFWDKVYAQAQARFGTTDINVNTFNKVWIVADHADVYQKEDTAFLVGSHLKVMLEQDFKAIEQNKEQFGDVDAAGNDSGDAKTQMASQLVREIIIPAIEKEVNDGQSFAAVRQIYNAEIMATWFKKTLRASLLGQVFADKSKIAGQKVSDPQAREKIFQQYLLAYKRGVFNFIKQEATPDGQVVPRRYLSGGMKPVQEVGEGSVNAFTPQEITPSSPAEEKTKVSKLENLLDQAMGAGQFQSLIKDQIAPITSISDNNPADVVKGIADSTQISPEDRAQIIAGLQKIDPGKSDPAAIAEAIAAPLKDKPNEAAQLVVNLEDQSKAQVAQEVDNFGTNETSLADKNRLNLAQVSLAPPPSAQQASVVGGPVTVQEHLNAIIPQVAGLQQDLAAYQGPDASLVQGDSNDIADTLADLKDQQDQILAQLQNDEQAAQPSVVVPQIDKIMPQIRILEVKLTALQDKVTDMALKQAIGKVTGNLGSAMRGLQQQRSRLVSQNPPANGGNQLNENPGGINLSNEHLTMNIKVDGAGMPLPPQYQDKALMDLNGLVSIIRSITPITQQNVPALYELAK